MSSSTNDFKRCTLVFLRKDNQVLLGMKKRGFGEGKWNGIGGKVEQGETFEAAMKRECQEEIFVTPLEYQHTATLMFKWPHDKQPWEQQVCVYTCTRWQGKPAESDEMAPAWFAFDDVPYNTMWVDDRTWLPPMLAGKLVQASFSFTPDNDMTSGEFAFVSSLPEAG